MTTDGFRARLTDSYEIPDYARSALILQSGAGLLPLQGPGGLFEQKHSPDGLTLRWVELDGPVLAHFPESGTALNWDGIVRVGGYVDAIHICRPPAVDQEIALVILGGHPLRYDTVPPTIMPGQPRLIGKSMEFHYGLAAEIAESTTTWLMPANSVFARQAESAMIRNARLHIRGALVPDEDPLHSYFALPLRAQSLTIYAP